MDVVNWLGWDCFLLELIFRDRSFQIKYRAGNKNKVNGVEKSSPYPMAKAIGAIKGSAPPNPYANGNSPATVVNDVINIGRNRSPDPLTTLSRKDSFVSVFETILLR
jgi:hypothetical protein